MLQQKNVPQSTVENVKNLFWKQDKSLEGNREYIPYIYLEAKIDFSDVRTGFRELFSVCKLLQLPPGGMEPIWNEDTLKDVDTHNIGPDVPDGVNFCRMPEYVHAKYIAWIETQFIQHLLRDFKAKVYRNFSLDVYSSSGESLNDFIIRCLDLCHEPMCREFDSLHEIFKRKLEQLQQKYLEEDYPVELETSRIDSHNRELFNRISDRISALFLRTEFSIQRITRPSGIIPRMQDLDERLISLHFEAQQAVTKVLDTYEEKARSVVEYILHPTMKDIHFVSSHVLWMPLGAL